MLCIKDSFIIVDFFDLQEIFENKNLLFNVMIFKVIWGKCVCYLIYGSKCIVDLYG